MAALDDAFDRDFWARLSPSEKLAETWRLSEELWEFSGRGRVNPDFRDLLRAFSDAERRFLVVGAYAVAAHFDHRHDEH